MTDRITSSTPLVCSDERHAAKVADLERQLAALRAVSRGYCPACGRGDAAPTTADWERERQRADRAEEFSRRALAQRQEMAEERYAWQQRGDRAEAAIARAREAATWIRRNYPALTHVNDRLAAALDQPTPGPATTQATDAPAWLHAGTRDLTIPES
jgi:hypothetical protein